MPIENRNLSIGTKLVGTYKKLTYRADVVGGEGDKLLYRLEDGREFKSPSAAGSALMDGKACNGWRFWSIDEEQGQKAPSNAEPESTDQLSTKARVIRKLPNQKGLPEGSVRLYCETCKESFVAPASDELPACPQTHSNPEDSQN